MIITNLKDVDYWFGPMRLPASGTLNLDDTSDTSLYLLNDEVADAVNTLYLASNITVSSAASPFPRPTGTPSLLHGDGSPEGMVYAPQGSLYMRRDSTVASTGLYSKTTGVTRNDGWVPAIAPTFELILQTTVEPAAPTITFESIPQTYTNLKIMASVSSTGASGNPNILMTVNGSSNPYYNTQVITAIDSDVTSSQNPNETSANIGFAPVSGSGCWGASEITIMNYTNPYFVPFIAISGSWDPGLQFCQYSAGVMGVEGLGPPTGPITSVTLTLSEFDFAVGSTATLYGL